MSSTRIFRATPSVSSSLTTAIFLYCNYELYRVSKGTHPYFSPRLEAAGILKRPNSEDNHPSADASTPTGVNQKPTTKARIETWPEKGEVGWTHLNGIPIPSFEMLIRPFRPKE